MGKQHSTNDGEIQRAGSLRGQNLETWLELYTCYRQKCNANPEENEYGGIYIFEDDASLEAYLASPILKEWAAHPDVSELTHKKYNTLPEFTRNTIKENYIGGDFVEDLAPALEVVESL